MSRHMRARDGAEQRATNLELFFDLVFVFAVTQLSQHLYAHLTWTGAAQTLFLLAVVWWAWIYTTWMTNWFDPESRPVRLVLVAVMLASLLMAVGVPHAFGDDGLLFAGGYVALQVVRNVFIVAAADRDLDLRPTYVGILSWSLVTGVFWIAGGVAHGGARTALWLFALALDYAAPYAAYWTPWLGRADMRDIGVEGAHFAERFQLFIIIALGESIVVTGATAANAGLGGATTLALVAAFVATAALWWLYFDYAAERSRADLARAANRGQLARDAFTYLHMPIVAGIILAAVGDELTIAHPHEPLRAAGLAMVCGGPALFLIGHNLFRLRMIRNISIKRVVATVALGVLAVAAQDASALAVAAAAAAILLVLAAAELERPAPRSVRAG